MDTRLFENIDWVGYVDWTVRDFHSFRTERGATYNSYLVRDEKSALIDTVKAPYVGDLLRNISALTNPADIAYVVCNHAEPDHAGGLPVVMDALPKATLICNEKCSATLSRYFDTSAWNIRIVKSGDSLSLGNRTLQFLDTPMLHWPESMFTYVPEEKLLFSMDAFGQHYATSNRFDDEVQLEVAMEEAKTYFANILMPFGKRITALLESAAGMDIEMIAPSHGVIWRSHPDEILRAYSEWAECRPKPKVLVIYDTQWDSTGMMARAIVEGASLKGVESVLINIRASNLTRIATEVLDAAAIAIGSSNLNRTMMPMVGALLTYLKGLKPVNKAGFSFGSYGWGRGAAEEIDAWYKEMKWEVLREPVRAKFRPTADALNECRAAGKMLAEKALEMAVSREKC